MTSEREAKTESASGADVDHRSRPADSKSTPPGQMSRLRRVLVAATAMGLSLVLALALLEFGLARFYYSNIDELRQDEFDEELGWRLKPGNYTIKAPQAFAKHTVFINHLGIRDPELAPSPPPGTQRIIVLGDSFTFGQAVSDEALFSTRLERSLNNRHPGVRYEVINAGVPGYGTAQELIMLRRLTNARIVGRIYLLNVFTNDILDNLRLDYGSRLENPVQPGFALDASGALTLIHKPQPILREGSNLVTAQPQPISMLYSVLRQRLRSLAQTSPGLVRLARNVGVDIKVQRMPGIISGWYDNTVLDKGIPLTKALLSEINTTVKDRNGVLLVSLIPSPMQVYADTYGEILQASFPDDPMTKRFIEDPTRPQRLLRTMCKELAISCLDMYDVLASKGGAFYFPADGHFNEAGHAVFAESLEQFISTDAAATH